MIQLGIKSDPIETRYSFDWLFGLMNDLDIKYLQLGSFFELYSLDLKYFENVREKAFKKDIQIKSLFTAHRELGGFFYNDQYMEKTARKMFERFIEVAALLGADYCGSNPGAVYRDQLANKEKGVECYLNNIKELSFFAKQKGLKGLTIEPMSCEAEPPTSLNEIHSWMNELNSFHQQNKNDTIPFYLCGDISHGWADKNREVISTNYELFEAGLPYMCEFHYKNTDRYFESTFGFSEIEKQKGIVDLNWITETIKKSSSLLPVNPITGYLEIGGPKTGRDYSDYLLGEQLKASIESIKSSLQ